MAQPNLLATLALAICGCGPVDHTIDIVFDPCQPLLFSSASSDPGDRQSIEEATALWNDLAGTELELADDAALVPIDFEKGATAILGLYDDERGVVVINRALEGRARTITIAHEIGHAMGLVHVKKTERRSVMVPANTDTPPGEADREALVALWGVCSSGD